MFLLRNPWTMTHKVSVLHCPHCRHEKVITNLEQRCVYTYQCKKCKQISSAKLHQEIFEFENFTPINAE